MDGNGNAASRQRRVRANDFIDAMRCAARIKLGAHHFIPQPRNRLAADIVFGRAADDFPAMVGRVTDCDDFQGHGPILSLSSWDDRRILVLLRLRRLTRAGVLRAVGGV